MNKFDLECEETVEAKPTGNYSGLLPTKFFFSSKWLDNSGYLITQWQKFVK